MEQTHDDNKWRSASHHVTPAVLPWREMVVEQVSLTAQSGTRVVTTTLSLFVGLSLTSIVTAKLKEDDEYYWRVVNGIAMVMVRYRDILTTT